MKNYLLVITIFYSTLSYCQSLGDLLNFKDMSLNQIEEKLILENWDFKRSDYSTHNKKSILDLYNDMHNKTYKSVTYEYIGYLGDVSTIIITDYSDKTKNDIRLISENKLLYKNILQDLVNAKFTVAEEESPYLMYDLLEKKLGDKFTIESNGKVYIKGNHSVDLLIYRNAIVKGRGDSNKSYYYDESDVTVEYQIIIN